MPTQDLTGWSVIDHEDKATWPKMGVRCLFYREKYRFSHFYGFRDSDDMVTMEVYPVRVPILQITAFQIQKRSAEEESDAYIR